MALSRGPAGALGALLALLLALSLSPRSCAAAGPALDLRACLVDAAPLLEWRVPLGAAAAVRWAPGSRPALLLEAVGAGSIQLAVPAPAWAALAHRWTRIEAQLDDTRPAVVVSVRHDGQAASARLPLSPDLLARLHGAAVSVGPHVCVREASGVAELAPSRCDCSDLNALRFSPEAAAAIGQEADGAVVLSRQRRSTGKCSPNPCQNDKACAVNASSPTGYTCACSELLFLTDDKENKTIRTGWEGPNCETSINECLQTPCFNGGACRNHTGSFSCLCGLHEGFYYTGDYCDVQVDQCGTSGHRRFDVPKGQTPCIRGNCTTVKIVGSKPPFHCACPPGYKDLRCSTDIDECEPKPCQNGANCTDLVAAYECTCVLGFNGTNCENNIDDCVGHACENGGTCVDLVNAYKCNCTDTGFKGDNCSINIDECEPKPCKNGAECVDGIKEFNCTCHPGYTGDTCATDIDECAAKPCKLNGTCLQRSDQSLYGNPKYQKLPPFNGAFDYKKASGYVCDCLAGSTGSNCQIDINECDPDPCQNGAKCINKFNAYECECKKGFRGRNCSENINECDPDPCKNNATCIDQVGAYYCRCAPPNAEGRVYGGPTCATEVVACRNHKCLNNAACKAAPAGDSRSYHCACEPGWKGPLCAEDTRLSLNGTDGVSLAAGKATKLSLSLRTSLADAQLLTAAGSLTVALSGGRLLLNGKATGLRLRAGAAAWTRLALDGGRLHLGDASAPLSPAVPASGLGAVTLGIGTPAFRGCLRDLQLDGKQVDRVNLTGTGWAEGCARTEQCGAGACGDPSRVAACVDLWNERRCVCALGVHGAACDLNVTAVTFGLNSVVSYSSFTVTNTMKKYISDERGFSFKVKLIANPSTASADDTLLLYYGVTGTLAVNKGFLLILITPKGAVKINMQYKTSATTTPQFSKVFTGLIVADGKERELTVAISEAERPKVTVHVSGFPMKRETIPNIPKPSVSLAAADAVFLGGYKGIQAPPYTFKNPSRVKRAAGATPPSEVTSVKRNGFKGVVYDTRTNDVRLDVGGSATTSGEYVAKPSESVGVETGLKNDDVCAKTKPCKNGGICTNAFFNSYKCKCTAGWRGERCEFTDYCATANRCPTGYNCSNVYERSFFECVGSVSFAPDSPSLGLAPSGATAGVDVWTLAVRLRTRAGSAMPLVSLRNSGGTELGRVELTGAGRVRASRSGSSATAESTAAVNSGAWTLFAVDWRESKVQLSSPTPAESETIVGGDSTGLAKVTSVVLMPQKKFKGCVSMVRINGYPASLHVGGEQANEGGPLKWRVTKTSAVESLLTANQGQCASDPVCKPDPCANKGECQDLWNAYKCNCTAEFGGEKCTALVCPGTSGEVAHSRCLNGGKCVAGSKDFTCKCAAGYVGYRCAGKDPCTSSPCKNGGSCTAEVKVDGNTSVASVVKAKCSCTDGWSGDTCEGGAVNYALIFGIVGALLGILIIILIVLIVRHVRTRRASHGVYDPHTREMNGSHVYMANVIKPPPSERLI